MHHPGVAVTGYDLSSPSHRPSATARALARAENALAQAQQEAARMAMLLDHLRSLLQQTTRAQADARQTIQRSHQLRGNSANSERYITITPGAPQ